MPYARCFDERKSAVSLLTFAGLLKGASLSNQDDFSSILGRPYDAFPFLKKLGRFGRGSDFERQLRTACRATFAGSHNVEMFADPPYGCGPVHASVPKWRSGCECRRQLNVPSPPCLLISLFRSSPRRTFENAYGGSRITCFSVFILAFCLAYERQVLSSRWYNNERIFRQGANSLSFPFRSLIIRSVDNEAFMKLFDDSFFQLRHALFLFRQTHKGNWSESFRVRWFPYLFAESAVERCENSHSAWPQIKPKFQWVIFYLSFCSLWRMAW